ncbi:MAG: SprT-like domain-containing protein [Verrucomicrobiia bacterium]
MKGFEDFFQSLPPRGATPLDYSAEGSRMEPFLPESKVCSESQTRDLILERRGRLLAARFGCRCVERALVVKWSGRLTTTAGLANLRSTQITLNIRLKEISEAEVERTFLHELAHLIAHERAGNRRIKAHGVEWRRACADLGIPNESVRHNLPFKRRKLEARFYYLCAHCGKSIARVRKIQHPAACAECCNRLNRGRFDRRFLLKEVPVKTAPTPATPEE